MAFAELWLPIFGAGIFIAWAIGAWYGGGSKILATWLIFCGVVCLLLLATIQWQHHIRASEDKPKERDIADAAKLERPWLYIINVRDQFCIDQDYPGDIYLTYSVANYGKSPAIITEGSGILRSFRYSGSQEDVLAGNAPMSFIGGHTLVNSPVIPASDVRRDISEYAVAGTIQGTVVERWFAPESAATEDVFLWIVLRYRGPFTEGHETSICLRWEIGSARWIKYHTNNYET
jgi:hypothetical protein